METFRVSSFPPVKLPGDPTRADHGASHPEHFDMATGEPLPEDRYDPRREPRSVDASVYWHAPHEMPVEIFDHNGERVPSSAYSRVWGLVSVRVSGIDANGRPTRFFVQAPGRCNGRDPVRPLTINGVGISGEGWVSVAESQPSRRAFGIAETAPGVRYVAQQSNDHGWSRRIDNGRGIPDGARKLLPLIFLGAVVSLVTRHGEQMQRQALHAAKFEATRAFQDRDSARTALIEAESLLSQCDETVRAIQERLFA